MSLPGRNNPYNFNAFLEWKKSVDYYRDGPFIQKVVRCFTGDEWEKVDAEAGSAFSCKEFLYNYRRWKESRHKLLQP